MVQNGERVYRRRWWILAVLCLSLLIIVLDNSILNVALPTLVEDLHASTSELQWIVDAYTLVFAGLLLAAGSLSDRFGRKKGLATGMVIFGAGSLLSSVAGSAGHLIATRAVMGTGAAFIMPSTLSILTNVFPSEERGRAIGIWAAMAGVGVPLGPILGGVLLDNFSWGAIFLVNVPIVVFALATGYFLLPESSTPEASPLDPIGVVLSIGGLVSLIYATIEAPTHGWTSTETLGMYALAAVLLASFVVWELRNRRPMIDLGLFRNPRFSSASLAIALVFFALFGSFFILTQYLQNVLGYTPLEAGVRLVPVAIGISVFAPLSSRIAEKIGAKIPVAFGLAMAAGGLAVLSQAGVDSSYGLVLGALLLFSSGMGLAMTPATDSIMGAVPVGNAGIGAAVNDTTRQVGGAFGVAVLGSVLSTSYRSDVAPSLQGLPPQVSEAASQSIGAAMEIADRLGGPGGEALRGAAAQAFVNGMQESFLIAAGVALVSSALALLLLPAFAREHPESKSAGPAAARPRLGGSHLRPVSHTRH
ncbi:MAG TPA: MFS transporter [Dehalococcoidia bacterium]|jgi:EmrB/QacA subfamily drug resistance transporter|nr:MFS transporter [Dehalococcoidia bacterium]